MKKRLFLGVALVAAVGLSAQEMRKVLPVLPPTVGVREVSVEVKKDALKYPVRPMSVDALAEAKDALMAADMQSSEKRVAKAGKMQMAKSAGTRATTNDELFGSTMYMQAYSMSEGGYVVWNVGVRKDEDKSDRYWFSDLSGYRDFAEMYGDVTNDTLLTIPNQAMGEMTVQQGTLQLRLVGLQMVEQINGNDTTYTMDTVPAITARIYLEDDIVAFTTDGFGIYITNATELGLTTSWYDAYVGAVMFTESAIPLSANYVHPQGTLFYGVSEPNGYSMTALYGIAPPDVTWTWTNLTETVATFEWAYEKLEYDLEGNETRTPYTATTTDLTMPVVYGEAYTYPTLTASTSDEEDTFTYGTIDAGDRDLFPLEGYDASVLIQAGGGTTYMVSSSGYEFYHLTNFNPDAGLVIYTNGSGYLFGTYSDGEQSLEALYSLYDAPLQPLSFMGVNVLGTDPGSLPLTMAIQAYSIDETGRIVWGDTIAFSDTYTYDGLRVQFTDFEAEDEDGFTSVVEEVQVEPTQGFALELGGFNQEGADFAVRSEYAERPDGENRSYFRMKNAEGTIDSGLYSWTGATYTMYMELAYAIYGEDPTTGIAPVESSNTTKLFSTADAFNFTYTDDFTSVDVYNVNGQKVSSYALPQTGTFSIAKAGLADGVYMFRMNGKTTEVLRAVK